MTAAWASRRAGQGSVVVFVPIDIDEEEETRVDVRGYVQERRRISVSIRTRSRTILFFLPDAKLKRPNCVKKSTGVQ